MNQDGLTIISDNNVMRENTIQQSGTQNFQQLITQRKRVLLASIAIIVLCSVIAFFLPVPYVAEEPGETVNVLGKLSDQHKIITITGAETYDHPGQLRMTSVSLYPNMTLLEIMGKWLNSTVEILPRAMVFPPDQSHAQIDHEFHEMFTHSEDNAAMAALNYLHLDDKKVHVTVNLPGIGGPSAGLMFALGTVSLLSPINFLHGRIIAGTGEITSDGKVEPIGGITLKLAAAHRDKARYFLVPADNCAEAMTRVPAGLTIIKVTSLSDAISALNALNSGRPINGCAA